MEDHEEKQLKADIMRKTMHSMDTRARTEVTIMAELTALRAWMAELIALRAWKEKARPFLNTTLNQLKDIPIPNLVDQQNIKALTELIKGKDEQG